MGDETELTTAFIDEHGQDVYQRVLDHAGVHAVDSGVSPESIPGEDDETDRLVYSLLEIAEHECGKYPTGCGQPLTDEEVFQFLLSHHSDIADHVGDLSSRGAPPRRDDLELVYPTSETAEIRAEVESDAVDDGPRPLSILAHDNRTDGRDDDLALVCLVPCTESIGDPASIPEQYPTKNGVPTFTDAVDSPVDVIVPVPKDVWVITSEIAPGFMTLDGWDVAEQTVVQAQIGVVATENPSKSRALLDDILGDGAEWPPGAER